MGRRKIEIKAIKDDRNRSVTFLKRKGGLFKKAHELAVLCSVDVAVIIFGHNKKLYEFSSCDMNETLARYQYFGPPHEHKGPDDFNGKRGDDDDDEDETTPGPEDMLPAHPNPSMVPPHLQNHPGFQHVNQAPSASPPMPNGLPFDPRHGTPQPQGGSRPTSRNHIRRVSSNLGPQHHATPPPPHHQPQNGFGYMPNPSMYNPNLGHQPPRPGQFPHYGHPPGPHPQGPPPPPHSMPPHSMTPQAMAQHHQAPQQHMHPPHQHPHPHPHPQAMAHPPPPPMGMSQAPPASVPQQAYLPPEQGRNSMPPALPADQPHRTRPPPEASGAEPMQGPMKGEGSQSPPQHHQRSLSSKSRSIFTPIDDRGSVLARHFGVGPPGELPGRPETSQEGVPTTKAPSQPPVPPPPSKAAADVPRTQSVPAVVTDVKPPVRSNSSQLPPKRPQLKVQIPSENSDGASAGAESSSSAGNKALTPAKGNADTNHSGVVLPPPSPSTGAILSAGAQGPPNPFARPPPPGTTAAQNNTAYNSNNNIETPISALPSRFVSDALLPSPSSFFPEWGFGRSGPDSNMLPSPLTFPTPAAQTGPGFGREDEQEKKRKSPDSGPPAEGTSKKTKT